MRTAVWFSRHQPTPAQIEDARAMGFTIAAIEEGIALGSKGIQTEEDLSGVLAELRALVDKVGAEAVFGVFPAPVMSVLHMQRDSLRLEARRVPLYAAWNIMRSAEGGKATFRHKEWLEVGQLRLWLMDESDLKELVEMLD